jgi:phosphomannomutase/phosphoglucomutase
MGMHAPKNIFREYDIRGVADRDLTDEVARAVGRVFGAMIGGGARIALGWDCRLSSSRLRRAVRDGMMSAGARVIEIGEGPTPLLYFAVHHLGTGGGLMITGSHNPSDENGFKMMRGTASFFGAEIQTMRARIEKDDLGPEVSVAWQRQTLVSHDVSEAYVDTIKERVELPSDAGSMKIVVDAGNGAGGPLALRCMRDLGLDPDPLFCEMDGRFPNHHPDPTVPKNLEALIARVRATGARVGIAYDGDADRLGAVDANGEIVWGDRLMILFSRAVLAARPGAAILGEVKCCQALYDDIAKHGGRPILWKTGHSLIKTKMKEEGALLAGEMSGHLFFADRYYGYDDAIYASLRLIEILAKEGRSIAELLADVPKTSTTPEIRVECADDRKFEVVRAVTEKYRTSGHSVLDIDGARISFGGSAWGLLRASNTGPVLVMRFEAATDRERDRIRAEVEGAVAEAKKTIAQGVGGMP